jgi:chromosome segregation ATPase
MGQWADELKKIAPRKAENKKMVEDKMELYQKAVDAAQKFVGTHSKSAPKLSKALTEMMEAEDDCAEVATELVALEQKLEKAKKDDKKDEMKKIESEMKPLIAKFDKGRKEMKAAGAEVEKTVSEIAKEAVAMQTAFA